MVLATIRTNIENLVCEGKCSDAIGGYYRTPDILADMKRKAKEAKAEAKERAKANKAKGKAEAKMMAMKDRRVESQFIDTESDESFAEKSVVETTC
jgi:hypothetical protein